MAAFDPNDCVEVGPLSFVPFVMTVAAVGGLIGLFVQFIKGDLL